MSVCANRTSRAQQGRCSLAVGPVPLFMIYLRFSPFSPTAELALTPITRVGMSAKDIFALT